MNSIRSIKNTVNVKMTPTIAFRLLFILFWTRHTIMNFAVQVFKRLPIVGMLGDYVILFLTMMLIILAFPYLSSRIRGTDVLFYLIVTGVLLLTILFFPKNGEYICKDLWRILAVALPIYFLGVCYDHELLKKDLYLSSLLGTVVMFAYQIYNLAVGRELSEDNMDAAYNVLPSVVYLLYYVFQHRNIQNWFFAAIGCVLVFIFGTRGPIVILVLYGMMETFIHVILVQNRVRRILYSILLVFIALLLICTDVILDVAVWLAVKFENYGFSTRIFDLFIKGDFAEDIGRNVIYEKIVQAISNKYLTGYGIMGDRIILQGTQQLYAHNFITEVLCEFGIFVGSVIIIWVVYLILYAISKPNINREFVLMLAVMVMTKLMLSGSYLVEPYFYLLLGVCITSLRRKRPRKRCIYTMVLSND